jgi:hypothetical protein
VSGATTWVFLNAAREVVSAAASAIAVACLKKRRNLANGWLGMRRPPPIVTFGAGVACKHLAKGGKRLPARA